MAIVSSNVLFYPRDPVRYSGVDSWLVRVGTAFSTADQSWTKNDRFSQHAHCTSNIQKEMMTSYQLGKPYTLFGCEVPSPFCRLSMALQNRPLETLETCDDWVRSLFTWQASEPPRCSSVLFSCDLLTKEFFSSSNSTFTILARIIHIILILHSHHYRCSCLLSFPAHRSWSLLKLRSVFSRRSAQKFWGMILIRDSISWSP